MDKKVIGVSLALGLILMGVGCAKKNVELLPESDAAKAPYNTAPIKNNSYRPVTSKQLSDGKTISEKKVEVTELSYDKAISLYGRTQRFQFVSCSVVSPSTISMKSGTVLMLDNRDKVKHVIGVGSKKYTISAFGFAVASVNEVGKLTVTCDGGGRGAVDVQP